MSLTTKPAGRSPRRLRRIADGQREIPFSRGEKLAILERVKLASKRMVDVLRAIQNFSGDYPQFTIPVARLAGYIHAGESYVRKGIAELQAAYLLSVEPTSAKFGGGRGPNCYQIIWSNVQALYEQYRDGTHKIPETADEPEAADDDLIEDEPEIEPEPEPVPEEVAADEAQWTEAVGELASTGVVLAQQAVNQARETGCQAGQVLAHIHVAKSKPGAYPPAILYKRIFHLHPNLQPEIGWPKESEEYLLALRTSQAPLSESAAMKAAAMRLQAARETGGVQDSCSAERDAVSFANAKAVFEQLPDDERAALRESVLENPFFRTMNARHQEKHGVDSPAIISACVSELRKQRVGVR